MTMEVQEGSVGGDRVSHGVSQCGGCYGGGWRAGGGGDEGQGDAGQGGTVRVADRAGQVLPCSTELEEESEELRVARVSQQLQQEEEALLLRVAEAGSEAALVDL